jgi:hypothetical protein
MADSVVDDDVSAILAKDPLDRCLTYSDINSFDVDGSITKVNSSLDINYADNYLPCHKKEEPLPGLAHTPTLPSVESPPQVEMKSLPHTLKYVFLGANGTLPVIINSSLALEEERGVVDLLKVYKMVIGWTMAYLKGIEPSFCMH